MPALASRILSAAYQPNRDEQVRHPVLSWLVVVIPALAELLVGGYKIGQPSLWRDEGYTLEVAQRPVGRIVAMLGHQDAVHGLYYIGMHLVIVALGTSATALRLPSLVAASLAAGLTAALGRRLASAAALPAASVTGLLAGLLLVAVPLTTWYAQDARPYAMATLCALGATYLLVRGLTERSRWWWAGYGAVIFVMALLNLLALLLVAAHGVSLLLMHGGRAPGTGASAGQPPAVTRRWLVATAAAIVALAPLIVVAHREAGQISWVTKPDLAVVSRLIAGFAGLRDLVPLVVALALAGIVADVGRGGRGGRRGRRGRPVRTPAAITLPWLVLPPVTLLAVSELHPVYVERYVMFCLPALALLTARGLAWLAHLAGLTTPGRRFPALTVLPSALLLAVMAATLVGPQQAIRRPAARVDDLRRVAAVVAANERPGDAVLYLPWHTRVFGLTYPGPFEKLRDIGLAKSPVASATLTGLPVPATLLARRLVQVQRLWMVRSSRRPLSLSALHLEQSALTSRMHLIRSWRIKSVELSLYAADQP